MPGSCPFINAKGETCGKGFAAGNSHCAHHRVRPAPKPSHPCASCGRPTKRVQGVCLGKSCGWNAYRRELAARKKAAAAEELAAQDAAEENQRRTEEAAEELAAALDGLRPWPEWMGVTADEFEAAAERQEADKAAQRAQQEAEAALVEALQAAEAEAAAAAARDRAAREQLDRLRRACAATRLGTLVPAGAALAR